MSAGSRGSIRPCGGRHGAHAAHRPAHGHRRHGPRTAAAAVPDCTDIAPNTRICRTPGTPRSPPRPTRRSPTPGRDGASARHTGVRPGRRRHLDRPLNAPNLASLRPEVVAARAGVRRGDRLRRPGQHRGQRQRRGAVRLPAGLGHRRRQRDGRPGAVSERQTGPGHRPHAAGGGARPDRHHRPASPTGCRPNWWPSPPTSPRSSAARSPCICSSGCPWYSAA